MISVKVVAASTNVASCARSRIDCPAQGFDGLVGLRAARVEGAEVGPGVGLVRYGCGGAELTLSRLVVLLLLGGHGPHAVRVLRKLRLRAVGEERGLFEPTADDGRSVDVVLAEIVDGVAVERVDADRRLKSIANLDRETQAGDGTGAVSLHAVGAASPVLRGAVAGKRAESGAALRGGCRGERLRIVRAAEQQMRLTMRRVVRRRGGQDLLELRDGVVVVALEQGASCGGKIGARDAREAREARCRRERERRGECWRREGTM